MLRQSPASYPRCHQPLTNVSNHRVTETSPSHCLCCTCSSKAAPPTTGKQALPSIQGHTQPVNPPSALLVLHQRPACEVARLPRQLEHLLIQAQLVAGPQHSGAHPANMTTHTHKHTCANTPDLVSTERILAQPALHRDAHPACTPLQASSNITQICRCSQPSVVSGTAGCGTSAQWCAPCNTWRQTCARHHTP